MTGACAAGLGGKTEDACDAPSGWRAGVSCGGAVGGAAAGCLPDGPEAFCSSSAKVNLGLTDAAAVGLGMAGWRPAPIAGSCSLRWRATWTRCSASLACASRWERKRSASFSGVAAEAVTVLLAARGAMGAGFTAAALGAPGLAAAGTGLPSRTW